MSATKCRWPCVIGSNRGGRAGRPDEGEGRLSHSCMASWRGARPLPPGALSAAAPAASPAPLSSQPPPQSLSHAIGVKRLVNCSNGVACLGDASNQCMQLAELDLNLVPGSARILLTSYSPGCERESQNLRPNCCCPCHNVHARRYVVVPNKG